MDSKAELLPLPGVDELVREHGSYVVYEQFADGDLDGIGNAYCPGSVVVKAPRPKTIEYLKGISEQASVFGSRFEGGVKWETNRPVGSKINYSRFLEGKERFMSKLKFTKDAQMLRGSRVIVNLSAVWSDTQMDLNRRAASSLGLVSNLQERDIPVEVIFTWPIMKKSGTGALFMTPIKDPTMQQCSVVSSVGFFRSIIFSAMEKYERETGRCEFGFSKGIIMCSYTDVKALAMECGILDDGDIMVNWEYDLENQIKDGLEQIDLFQEAERDE